MPNISGQNGKKALDNNIIGAIQCKFATFGTANEMKQVHCLGINWLSLLVDVMPNLTLFWLSWTVWFGKCSDIPIINIRLLLISLISEISRQQGAGGCHYNDHHSLLKISNFFKCHSVNSFFFIFNKNHYSHFM